ncbi:MAG TPA: hypothetical protein ENJ28_07720 [Gammaproteobacteria bacterium]|nr:hypothetical protein [Gammaproteobacteria bacterium]
MKNHSLFSFGPGINPLYLIDKWLNPYIHNQQVTLKNKPLSVRWTRRAQRALLKNTQPLIVEMQLYFSCVIKKRVLFRDTVNFDIAAVNDKLSVAFNPVEAASCDPLEFAKSFPEKRIFDSSASQKMHPKYLKIDYKNQAWQGEFTI